MMGLKGYVVIGVLVYVIALIGTIPAGLIVDRIVPEMPVQKQLQITQADGTLFNGSANVSIGGKNTGRWHWRLRLFPLLFGSLGLDLDWNSEAAGHLAGMVEIGLDSSILVLGTNGNMAVDGLRAFFPKTVRRWIQGGELEMDIQRAELDDGVIRYLDGTVTWHQGQITSLEHLDIGNLNLQFSTDEKGIIKGLIQDSGNMLEVRGNLLVNENGDYRGDLSLADRSGNAKGLGPVLSMLGRADKSGVTRINFEGSLY